MLIERLACTLHVEPLLMEKELSAVEPTDLARAALEGVDLQNHAWSHLNPTLLSERERIAEVLRNEEYLSQFRKATIRVFAPPFGHHVGPSVHAHFVLLANRNLILGHRDGNLVNRVDSMAELSWR